MSLFAWLRRLPANPLILLSNREPFVHHRAADGTLAVVAPAGGLTSALQPMMAAVGGTWIAWGSGSAAVSYTHLTLPTKA